MIKSPSRGSCCYSCSPIQVYAPPGSVYLYYFCSASAPLRTSIPSMDNMVKVKKNYHKIYIFLIFFGEAFLKLFLIVPFFLLKKKIYNLFACYSLASTEHTVHPAIASHEYVKLCEPTLLSQSPNISLTHTCTPRNPTPIPRKTVKLFFYEIIGFAKRKNEKNTI